MRNSTRGSVPGGPGRPSRRSGPRAVTTALALSLAVALSACSGGEPDPARQPDLRVDSDQGTATTPVATPALDECSLLSPAEMTPPGAKTPYTITSRSAAPDPGGDGWRVTCGYGPRSSPFGQFVASVRVTTAMSTKAFAERAHPGVESDGSDSDSDPTPDPGTGEPSPTETPGAPRRLSGLGDEAWVTAETVDSLDPTNGTMVSKPTTATVRVLRGTTALEIALRTPTDAEPDLDRVTELGRTALPRLPETFTVPPVRLDGACAKVNRALAVKAAGVELPGARSVTAEATAVCELSGTTGLMTITASGTPRSRAAFEEHPDSVSVHRIANVGDAAYSTASDPLEDLWIRSGDQVIRVARHRTYAPPDPEPTTLRGDRLAFLQQVVQAFGN